MVIFSKFGVIIAPAVFIALNAFYLASKFEFDFESISYILSRCRYDF